MYVEFLLANIVFLVAEKKSDNPFSRKDAEREMMPKRYNITLTDEMNHAKAMV